MLLSLVQTTHSKPICIDLSCKIILHEDFALIGHICFVKGFRWSRVDLYGDIEAQ